MAQASYTNISVRLSSAENKALEAVHRYENRGMGKVSKAQVIRYSFLEYIKQNPEYSNLLKDINLDEVVEEEEE